MQVPRESHAQGKNEKINGKRHETKNTILKYLFTDIRSSLKFTEYNFINTQILMNTVLNKLLNCQP